MTDETNTPSEASGCGYIFATTGEEYTALAKRSAERLKALAPQVQIDLYTDTAVRGAPFDQVFQIDSWFRPKFEALARSRFSKTIYLDADTWVMADPSDIFKTLDRFDLALAHDPYRATEHATTPWRTALPASFPQYNSGVIGVRRSAATDALFHAVIEGVKQDDLARDQGVLRELLFFSDLRIATLPEEYNLMGLRSLNILSSECVSPRILHSPRLHATFRKGKRSVDSIDQLVGQRAAQQLVRLAKSDVTLNGDGSKVRPLIRQGFMDVFSLAFGLVRGRFER